MWETLLARNLHYRGRRLWRNRQHYRALACAAQAATLLETRHRRVPGGDPGELVAALTTQARYYAELADFAAAERSQQRAVTLLRDRPTTSCLERAPADALISLAATQRARGRYVAAEATLRGVLNRPQGWDDDPDLHSCALNTLGVICKDAGRYAEAERHYLHALNLSGRSSREHQGAILHNLAGLAHAQSHFEQALEPARQALRLHGNSAGPRSTAYAADVAVLGAVLAGLGRLEEAEAQVRLALALWQDRYGPDHYEVAVNLHNLGLIYQQQGKPDLSLACLSRALGIKEGCLGADHVEVAALLNSLGVLHSSRGRIEQARDCYRRAIAVLQNTWGAEHPTTRQCRTNAACLPCPRQRHCNP